jgi:hypothetical protein
MDRWENRALMPLRRIDAADLVSGVVWSAGYWDVSDLRKGEERVIEYSSDPRR